MARVSCFPYVLSLAMPLLVLAEPALAWVGVGPDPSCEVRTIQAALDRIISRESHGDFVDPLIVVAAGTYNEALRINAAGISGSRAVVAMIGGYDSGCHGPAGGDTTINAANRSASALTINGTIALSLDSLHITGGNTSGNGGGINFGGSGSLDLTNVSISGNHAGYGGGLFANGPSNLTINLHSTTTISDNVADHAGGGIRIQGHAQLFMSGGSALLFNSVTTTDSDGAGGGLQIVSPAHADIESSYISGNSARYGGGVAANGGLASVVFNSNAGENQTQISYNSASNTGGGIFLSKAAVDCRRCLINGNTAQEGAATYADVGGGIMAIDSGTVRENVAQTQSGIATGGSTMLTQTDAVFNMYRTVVRNNRGGHVYRGFRGAGAARINQSLIADNQVTDNLFVMEEKGEAIITSSTVAHNVIGGSSIFFLTGSATLTDSIVWDFKTTLSGHPGITGLNISNVIAWDKDSLCCFPGILNADPRFVAPATGDYHLLPVSPAIDYSPAQPGTDLEGFPRTVDLSSAPNRYGPLDLGAYEARSVDENFDELAPPALPVGWINSTSGASAGWITTTSNAFSAPNAAFTDDTATVTDKWLQTPPYIAVANSRLTFRHMFDVDASGPSSVVTFDGVVLEISVNGAPFKDIFAAGGSFAGGGYDHIVYAGSGNPLANRNAWGGNSNGYRDVVVNLPAGAGGSTVAVRWRMGTDAFEGGAGYWLDDIHVNVTN
jgi:hypothetical protein